MIKAPFTLDQVDALNRHQKSGFMHPFTCAGVHDGDHDLVTTPNGWICPGCDYTQDWAHGSMLEKPINPFSA